MGSGISKPDEASEAALGALPLPVAASRSTMLFSVLPEEEELKRRGGSTLLLEVGIEGLRLLRPATEMPVGMFPWSQIHSWATGESHSWWFKYFDEGKRSVLQHRLGVRDVEALQAHVQGIIDVILDKRKESVIGSEQFEQLLERMRATGSNTQQLEMVKEAAAQNAFSSGQGKLVIELLPTAWDKMEAATVLHGKLVDQNRFSHMLHALECQADRDNVWHRITLIKKQASSKC